MVSNIGRFQYNPEAAGLSTADLEIQNTRYAGVDTLRNEISRDGLITFAFMAPVLGMIPGVLVGLLIFSVVGGPVFIFGGMIAGAIVTPIVVGIAYLIAARKVDNYSKAIFANISDRSPHELNPVELKNVINSSIKINPKLTSDFFNKMSPKQIHSLLADDEAEIFQKYIKQNPHLIAITNGRPNLDLLHLDPYYRAIYFEWKSREHKQIEENIFAKDYPHIVAKIRHVERGDKPWIHEHEISVIDANTHELRRVKLKYLTACSSDADLSKLTPDHIFEVRNLREMNKLLDILERKTTISDREELEAVTKVAEEWRFDELIKDLQLMVRDRKDLFENQEELQKFLENHPAFKQK